MSSDLLLSRVLQIITLQLHGLSEPQAPDPAKEEAEGHGEAKSGGNRGKGEAPCANQSEVASGDSEVRARCGQ